MRTLEGTGRVTPIKMSELNNRIGILEAKGEYEIVTINGSVNGSTGTYAIPEKYRNGWNFLVLSGSAQGMSIGSIPGARVEVSKNNFKGTGIVGNNSRDSNTVTLSFSKSGNSIIANASSEHESKVNGSQIEVMFYK